MLLDRLKIEDVKPIVMEHKEAIMAATKTSAAEWVMKDLKVWEGSLWGFQP